MRLILACFISVAASVSIADEIKVMCGVAPYENVFAKIQPKFEKATGHKIVFVHEFAKAGGDLTAKKVLEGGADVGSAAIPFEAWTKIMKDKGIADDKVIGTLTHRVIGKDIIKVFTHPSANVKKLSFEQLDKVFRGEIKNWKEVGGKDLKISVVIQTTYPATNDFFKTKVMNKKDFMTDVVSAGSVDEMVSKITSTNGAIGFVSSPIPTPNTTIIETGDVIGRPVTAITKGKPSPLVGQLFDFISKELK